MDILPVQLQPLYAPLSAAPVSRPASAASETEAVPPDTLLQDQYQPLQSFGVFALSDLPAQDTLEQALEQGLKRLKNQPELIEEAQSLRQALLPLLGLYYQPVS